MSNSIGLGTVPRSDSFLSRVAGQSPHLTLSFYSFGIVLRKEINGITTEHPVDPQELANTLGAHLSFDSGILGPNVIAHLIDGNTITLVEWRPPQMTGVWLEGLDNPIRIPMPGLILMRRSNGSDAQYALFATNARIRPATYDVQLFSSPLPNVGAGGGGNICWGSVAKESRKALKRNNLEQAWDQLFGSRWGNHAVPNKSKKYPKDIRDLYLELEKSKSRRYPIKDLIPTKLTLGQVLRSR